jgi:hypothetical protein
MSNRWDRIDPNDTLYHHLVERRYFHQNANSANASAAGGADKAALNALFDQFRRM